jgi:hypothetical protein
LNKNRRAAASQRLPLPSAQNCYERANLYIEMWNESADHAAQSWLLQTAGAWMQLASDLNK